MAPLPQADPGAIGLNPDRLDFAYRLLEEWTGGPKPLIPGGAGSEEHLVPSSGSVEIPLGARGAHWYLLTSPRSNSP